MIRLYFNLTNKCNSNCEFCCMWSDTTKNTFLSFEKYKEIIDSHIEDFELQLEGGEPFLHQGLYLFMEYAIYTKKCKKIVISTNGKLLEDNLERLINFSKNNKINILIKPSINYWLINENPNLIKMYKNIFSATEFIPEFNIIFNVRLRKNKDENIRKILEKENLEKYSSIYYLQKYGKFENEEEYDEPFINQNIDDWFIYSCDGISFNKDLIKRSKYEKTLK